MKYEILAQSFNPKTGEPNAKPYIEIIDIHTNNLFKDCKTLIEVTDNYMNFWNHFPTIQRELVLVQSIKRI